MGADRVKQYEFKERGGFAVTGLVLAFFLFGDVVLSSVGIKAVIFVVLCGAFVLGVTVYTCFQTRIISEAGITVKTILKTIFVPWQAVERIGVAHLPIGRTRSWNLAVTYRTDSGKHRELLIPCTDALRAAVAECYGALHFDERDPGFAPSGRQELPERIIHPWQKDRMVIAVLAIYMSLLGLALGIYAGAWLPVVVMPLLGLSFMAVFGLEFPDAVLSDAGVLYRFLFRRHFLPWQEFIQAGICLFENKKAGGVVIKSYKLGLLLPNGIPKRPGLRFPQRVNRMNVVYLPDTPEIRDFVIAHYGLLDFDESADPRGFSIVVD